MESSAGAETSLHAVDPLLFEAGFDIHLAVLTQHRNLLPSLVRAGIVAHDLSGRSPIGTTAAVAALIRRTRPDLVHASLLQAALPSQLVSPLFRVPVLVTWASTPVGRHDDAVASWKRVIVRTSEVLAGHMPGCRFHAVTAGVARTKARELRLPLSRVRVAERGRDERVYHPASPGERSTVRADLGVNDPDEFVFLSVGRQEPEKDYDLLLRSFDRVRSASPVRLVIAGRTGSSTQDLHQLHRRLDHPDRVVFLGQREDVPQLLGAADAVVCTSRREGAAGSLIEAMGTGTPILSVPLDGLDGVLEHERNALVVPREELTAGMVRMVQESDLRRRLADEGRRTFLTRFTVERSAQALADVYRWAAGRN